jgi:hypothetical protein
MNVTQVLEGTISPGIFLFLLPPILRCVSKAVLLMVLFFPPCIDAATRTNAEQQLLHAAEVDFVRFDPSHCFPLLPPVSSTTNSPSLSMC